MTYRELLLFGTSQLKNNDIAEAALDARLLLEYISGCTPARLLMLYEEEAGEELTKAYLAVVEKRAKRIPLQQLMGQTEFMGLSFQVNEHVLTPRQDTEILVEEAMRELSDGFHILDLCTGSGCILLSLLHYSNETTGIGVDLSMEALTVAKENAQNLGLSGRCEMVFGDLYEGIKDHNEKFDLLVSNPPYIRQEEYEGLMPEVRDHEPYMALVAEENGLIFYRRILDEAPQYLHNGAYVMFEIGCEQGRDVSEMMINRGYRDVSVIKDLAGLDRVVRGQFAK